MTASRAVRKRTGASDAARAQRLADVAAVGVGQADVDDEGVGSRLGGAPARRAVGDGRDLEALLGQPAAQQRPQVGVVLDDEQAQRGHRACMMTHGPRTAGRLAPRASAERGPRHLTAA